MNVQDTKRAGGGGDKKLTTLLDFSLSFLTVTLCALQCIGGSSESLGEFILPQTLNLPLPQTH
jgi:hypothetical protein